MNYDMKQSGKRIQQLRIKNGLTQEQVAEVLNIDRSFYSRIEAGKSGCSVDLFVQLSMLFEVSLDYLILGEYSRTLFADTEKLLLKEEIEKLVNHLRKIKEIL
ncbi:MAG: helix-turn-helix transcriptional regulator [Clostridiales bacterium]|nr:helix-turn-helix transcriptional regulator [Clostridiales bacterium]